MLKRINVVSGSSELWIRTRKDQGARCTKCERTLNLAMGSPRLKKLTVAYKNSDYTPIEFIWL